MNEEKCNPRVRAAPLSPFPLSRILSPQVTARGSAQFPGYNSMGYTDVTAGGISGDRTRDLAVLLHKSLRAY